jgi:acetyltransferase-like isoleucine patch superfamily enzyme
MLTPVLCPPEAKQTAIAAEAMKQGQWVYMSSNDGSPVGNSTPFQEVLVSKVDSTSIAQYAVAQLFPVMKYAADLEYAESVYEDIAINDQVVILVGDGIEIEDDALYGYLPHAGWASQTPGTSMSLTASGYPTFADGPGHVTAHTEVAYFVKYENSIITYQTA